MDWLRFFADLAERLFRWWRTTEEAAKRAEVEQAAEIERADRAKANHIRETIDRARLGGGLQPRDNDNRGYRRD